MHLLNYAYDASADRVVPAENVRVTLRALSGSAIRVYTLEGETSDFTVEKNGEDTVVTLKNAGVYTAIVCE